MKFEQIGTSFKFG